ncbi:MAG: hypothetical protein KJ048_02585 [Dehalococcoidia bacterium]|nr:hypothetical protein [Dehalococcoidia bacterium]
MASFEGARPGVLGEAIREWRFSKFIPLYLAGIAAGAGLGIGIATWPASEVVDAPESAPSFSAPAVVEAPVFAPAPAQAPAPVETGINAAAIAVELPIEFIRAMGGLPAIEPAPPAATPAAPIVPVVPASQAPSAPAPAPAVQPAAQPEAPVAPPVAVARPNFYVPEVSSGPATDMELRLFNLLNEQRAAEGLAPYVLDAGLTKVARTRSQQLIDQNYFAHTDPYGYSMYVELLAHFGFTSYAWAGENLAMNNYAVVESPERATTSLMNSPTHRANIMATDFFRVGIGEITDARGRHYFTMIFLG